MKQKTAINGFTLIELMVVLVIIGIIAAWGAYTYTRYIKQSRLNAAQSALLENANYLENFYSKNYRYNEKEAEGCNWPILPKDKVANFDIAFSSENEATNCQRDSYILEARPAENYRKQELRYLKINQNKNILLCHPAKNENEDDRCELSSLHFDKIIFLKES